MANQFVLICKMVGQKEWAIVSNPVYEEPHSEFFAAQILDNFAVEYVEYVNSGVVNRLIRRRTMGAYGLTGGDRP